MLLLRMAEAPPCSRPCALWHKEGAEHSSRDGWRTGRWQVEPGPSGGCCGQPVRSQQLETAARVLPSPDRGPSFSGAQRVRRASWSMCTTRSGLSLCDAQCVRSLSAVTISPPYRTECPRRSPVRAPAGAPRPAAAFHRPHCSKSRTPRARPAPRTRG